MSEYIVPQMRHIAHSDPVLEWLQSVDDGVLFDCHDLAEIFGYSDFPVEIH